jgi:hypothetical protein
MAPAWHSLPGAGRRLSGKGSDEAIAVMFRGTALRGVFSLNQPLKKSAPILSNIRREPADIEEPDWG